MALACCTLAADGAATAAPSERIQLVSQTTLGEAANSSSCCASLGAEGRVVAYQSFATNLGRRPDRNGNADVFVYDRTRGVTTQASVSSSGVPAAGSTSVEPALSGDGRVVAFASGAENLVPGDTNEAFDVFVRDLAARTTERVDVSSAGAQAKRFSFSNQPALSADGRFVAFASDAPNLVPGDTNGAADVFVRDRLRGVTERVSVPSGGGQANDGSGESVAISSEGDVVVFVSSASNLVAGDTNGGEDVFVHNRTSGETERVSVAADGGQVSGGGCAGGERCSVAVSADGLVVAWSSAAQGVVPGPPRGRPQVFVRDRVARTTRRVSQFDGRNPSITPDGRSVAFDDFTDVFVRNLETGALVRIDARNGLDLPTIDQPEIEPSIAPDGQTVAFTSDASSIVQEDPNLADDVFIRIGSGDTTPPVVAPAPAPRFVLGSVVTGERVPVDVRWGAHDASRVCRERLGESVADGPFVAVPLPSFRASAARRELRAGTNQQFRVQAIDCTGVASDWIPGPAFHLSLVDDGSADVTYVGRWRRVADAGALAGGLHVSGAAGARARFAFSGSAVAWVAPRRPGLGTARVRVDGAIVGTVDLAAAGRESRRVVFARTLSPGAHVLSVESTSAAPVALDGLAVVGPRVPDRKIVFVGDRDGLGIYVMNATGGGVERLTSDPSDASPAWSPDGKAIAFTREGPLGTEIFEMRPDGSGVRFIGPGAEPAWAPDGLRLAFTDLGQVFVMNRDGGGRHRLTEGSEPAWSPDGRQIAFAREDVYVMDADGSNVVKLRRRGPHATATSSQPTWKPDGSRIAFVERIQVGEDDCFGARSFVMTMDRSGARVRRAGGLGRDLFAADPSWTPDGRGVLYAATIEQRSLPDCDALFQTDVARANLDGTATDLTNTPFPTDEREPDFRPADARRRAEGADRLNATDGVPGDERIDGRAGVDACLGEAGVGRVGCP